MNFRTTAILIGLLIGVGAVLFFTRDSGEAPAEPKVAKLLDVESADVTRVSFTNDQSQKIALERSDGKWKVVEPVKAPAEEFAASGLVDALTALQSRGQVAVEPITGLDAPRYKVELATKSGKTIKFDVGSRSGAGDNLYVKRDGQSQADVVSARILEQLDKPLKDWRRAKLFDVSSTDIKQVRIASSQPALAMQKDGADWKITEPQPMPADSFAASDITSAVANLRAEEYVESLTSDRRRFGLEQPVMSVSFSTQAPSTQPSATQPAITTIQFGRFDDVLKKNIFASLANDPGVFKVSASVLDSFRKKPLDLRDKRVVTIDPDKTTRISINMNKAATTQPTTREASSSAVVLERAKRKMGPLLPVTMPATTQASSQPVEPPSKWNVASSNGADADDSKIDALLRDLNPLRASKFLDATPTNPPVTATVVVETTDARHEIRVIDPGNSQPLVGAYNGLAFEVSRTLLEQLEADFVKGKSAKPSNEPPAPGSHEHPH